MSSTITHTTGVATSEGTTGAVEGQEHVVTGVSAPTVLAVTRLVLGIAFVLGLRRQSV